MSASAYGSPIHACNCVLSFRVKAERRSISGRIQRDRSKIKRPMQASIFLQTAGFLQPVIGKNGFLQAIQSTGTLFAISGVRSS
jgi:hypothetical protein